ncbi:hypothetical protein MICAD_2750003 [Microcystis aeruginosa PCC 7941]|nr:hypothetical protein MICAD_2750003 [Microcystis aeruginosa PCC 7941]
MSGVILETIMEIKNIKQKARNLIDKLPEILHGMICSEDYQKAQERTTKAQRTQRFSHP